MNSEDLLFIDFETNKQGDFYLMGYQVNGDKGRGIRSRKLSIDLPSLLWKNN